MPDLSSHLAGLACFRGVPADDLRAAATEFRPRVLTPGEVLWSKGQSASSLALIVEGSLQARTTEANLSRMGPGDIVGEVTAFFPSKRRSADVVATGPCRLMELSTRGLQRLRGTSVYLALLDHALVAMAKRLRRLDGRIAAESLGSRKTPSRSAVPGLVRLWRTLVAGGPKSSCPPLHVALRRRKDLNDVAVDLAVAMKDSFKAVPVEEGEVVFLEGEEGDALWLVAEGTIEVLRTQDEERSELVVRLGPGAFFGMNAVLDGGLRGASCVAATAGWLYKLDRGLVWTPPGKVALAWKEAQLVTLATQLRRATTALDSAQLSVASGQVMATDADDAFDELSWSSMGFGRSSST